MIDVEIPANRNVVHKEAEKKLKYKSLCLEILRTLNLKCGIIQIIIGATETFGDHTRKTFVLITQCGKYCSLKLEPWAVGWLLVQGKYQGEQVRDKGRQQQHRRQHHHQQQDDVDDDNNNNNNNNNNIAVLRTCVVGTTPASLNVWQYVRS